MNCNQDQFSMHANQHPNSEIVCLTNPEILTDFKFDHILIRKVLLSAFPLRLLIEKDLLPHDKGFA